MKILVFNAGSSSLKYSLFDMTERVCLVTDLIEIQALGENATLENSIERVLELLDEDLAEEGLSIQDCQAIGHRVVHGGEIYHQPVVLDPEVISTIRELSLLAPLHNPVNLIPIEAMQRLYPKLEQVAIFDTAFHHTLPDYAYRYALPDELYEKHQIRRYGFHGSSHQYITRKMAQLLAAPASEMNLIICHLGNGASITAVEDGLSIDTSMGFTPLEGLVMGTRSGDLDPAIPVYLIEKLGYTAEEVDHLLNKESGLKGLCGQSDMRSIIDLANGGEHHAQLALDIFIYRIVKQIGSFIAILDDLEAIVFTGGIGEHSELIREEILSGFSQFFAFEIDIAANEAELKEGHCITTDQSLISAWVIPTDEALEIAEQTEATLRNQPNT